jgi:predicted O-methyltransferase YrrM
MLAKLIVESEATMAVELGVHGGRSLIAMGFGMAHLGRGHVDGIDPYDKQASLEGVARSEADREYWANEDYEDVLLKARNGIWRAGVQNHVHIIRARSRDVVSRYTPGTIDVLHQDGNHSELVSLEEVRLWMPLVRPGGFWVFDDLDWSTTHAASNEVRKHCDPVEVPGQWGVFRKRG